MQNAEVVPIIFSHLPSHYSTETIAVDQQLARSEKVEQTIKEKEIIENGNDKVVSVDELLEKLDRNLLPDDILENKIIFICLCL